MLVGAVRRREKIYHRVGQIVAPLVALSGVLLQALHRYRRERRGRARDDVERHDARLVVKDFLDRHPEINQR